jgi:hypothetical protein
MPLSFRKHFAGSFATPFATLVVAATVLSSASAARPAVAEAACPNQQFRTGAAAQLPDCRAYEMVSPVDKNDSDIAILPNINSLPAGFAQAAVAGDKLSYPTYRAFAEAEGSPYTSQYIASRTATGWQSRSIAAPQGLQVVDPGFSGESQYRYFSPDLCNSALIQYSDRVLAPGAIAGYPDVYLRSNCGSEGYESAINVAPSPIPPASQFPPASQILNVQGASANGSCVVFSSNAQLTPNAQPSRIAPGETQVYESCGDQPQLVSTLPDGTPARVATTGSSQQILSLANMRGVLARNAVSANAERVYWTEPDKSILSLGGPGSLYLRENASQPPSAISGEQCTEPTKACTLPVYVPVSPQLPGRFWYASPDGSAALYTVGRTAQGAFAETSLFEYSAATQSSHLIAEEVLGLMGASEDLSRVYLVSRQALAEGAQVGAPNLYLYEAGDFRFVGVLSAVDALTTESLSGGVKGRLSPVQVEPNHHTSYVTPDGQTVVFMSTARLTAYDNTDGVTGNPDAEVYRYSAGGSPALVCVSCNSTGAAPLGVELPFSNVAGGALVGAAQITRANNQLYAPRVLSDDGTRVFFESFEALLPTDVNGQTDVYEWEAPGAGDCTTAAPAFSPSNGGCISLISSGRASRASAFVDASADGSSAFFTTIGSLVAQDEGQVDIYDAQVGGGFPEPPSSPGPCVGEACQPPGTQPTGPAPASSSFNGPGNQQHKHEKKHHKKKHQHHKKKDKHEKKSRTDHKQDRRRERTEG